MATPTASRAPLLLRAAMLLAVLAAATAQAIPGYMDYVTGTCFNYQTSRDFTQSYVDEQMVGSEDGFVLALSTGNTDSCQRLSFTNDQEFRYSFIDIANFPRTYISRYSVTFANLTQPASIKLNMLPLLLGADSGGRLIMKPLIADAEKLVVAACWQRGHYKREQLQVFIPSSSTASAEAIKEDLMAKNLIGAESLEVISQDCVAGIRKAAQPIPLRSYHLVLALYSTGQEKATFRSGIDDDRALEFYQNFKAPTVSKFAIPSSPFYKSTAAVNQPAIAAYQPAVAGYQPDGSVYQPEGSVYQPARAVYQPSGAVYQPSGAVYQTSGAVYQPPSVVYQPAGAVSHPATVAYQPAGAVYQPAGAVSLPATVAYQPAGAEYQPAGTVYQQGGAVYQPAGTESHPATVAYQPAGAEYQPSGAVYQQGEAVYNPAGALYQPAGAFYQPQQGLHQPAYPVPYSAPQGVPVYSVGPSGVFPTNTYVNPYTGFYL